MVRNKQNGVVSLFIVIFTTLLLTVLVVGFLRIMVQEQKQATNQDLSQSAYDSAVSGVEDAKRVLRACSQGVAAACNAIDPADATQKCKTVTEAGIISPALDSSETIIKSDGSSTTLNQGYTCVMIDRQTTDYKGGLTDGKPQLVPLKLAVKGDPAATATLKTVTIEWMHKDNSAGGNSYPGGGVASLVQPTVAGIDTLPPLAAWGTSGGANAGSPALLRAQMVMPSLPNAVTLDELDANVATTAYFRPSVLSGAPGATTQYVLPPLRATDVSIAAPTTTSPQAVNCYNDLYQNGDYACKVDIDVSARNVKTGSTVAFLRLNALYRDTSYRITVKDSAGVVLVFDGVQPVIDSTGRAGNLYRRISSRVDMSSLIAPPAAIDFTGNLCKDFYVTDNPSDASSTCSTKPTP